MSEEMMKFKQAIEGAMDLDEETPRPPPPDPVPLRPARPPRTLAEQMQVLESAGRELDGRLRREMVEARITAERKVNEAKAHHTRMLAEETARLDREMAEMIRQAGDEYHRTMHDLEVMHRRRTAVAG